MVQIGDVIVSPDIFTEYFCCDLEKCKGECCVEGDAGAPVTLEEVGELENVLEVVWPDLSAQAQAVIDKQGVAYTDEEGDLVTSIVGGKDCVFTYYDDLDIGTKEKPCVVKNCCLCATEKAFRAGKTNWCKPISCALYPIRVANLSNGLVGLNYNQWSVCFVVLARNGTVGYPIVPRSLRKWIKVSRKKRRCACIFLTQIGH